MTMMPQGDDAPLRVFEVQEDIYEAFAEEWLLFQTVQEGEPPWMTGWVHRSALVLGGRERRLPRVIEAMDWHEREGIRTMVRPSGGAAVPLDDGVLNVALWVAPVATRNACAVQHDFQQLAQRIVDAIGQMGVQASIGEVTGAVCPGGYDVHIDGYKVAGISQHRSMRGTLVHAFINVCGDAISRARWVAQLYQQAADVATRTEGRIPTIDPNVMTTIAQATGNPGVTTEQFWRQLSVSEQTPRAHRDVAWNARVREQARQLRQRYDPRGVSCSGGTE